jgi:hypothetical protein
VQELILLAILELLVELVELVRQELYNLLAVVVFQG